MYDSDDGRMMWNGFSISRVEDSIFLDFMECQKVLKVLQKESKFNPHKKKLFPSYFQTQN